MKTKECKKCNQQLPQKSKVHSNCGSMRHNHHAKRITIIAAALGTITAAATVASAWVGHIPASYKYNSELPKAYNLLAWANMGSRSVQSTLKSIIIQKVKEVRSYKAPAGFEFTTYDVPVKGGSIKMYCIQPESLNGKNDVSSILYFHGGAFYIPLTVEAINGMTYYAKSMNVRVFMPDYRTSIDNPFPVPLDDCYASALYIKNNSQSLGINVDKIIMYGDSAGGCLVASVSQYIRDFGGPKIGGQVLIYPVLDNSMKYDSMNKYKDAPWPLNANQNMWDVYLKNGDNGQIKYAAPMQSDNFGNLPQAYVEPSEIDILHDEALLYAKKLEQAGTRVQTYVVPGGYHGFDRDQSNAMVKAVLEKRVDIMKQMIK